MSAKLYQYMCEIVGSEEVVKTRRFFLDVVNYLMNGHEKFSIIISGSKGEGLDMPGSDVDIMIVVRDFEIHSLNDKSGFFGNTTLIAETDITTPGFVMLRLPKNCIFGSLSELVYEERFLSNYKFKRFCQLKILGCESFDFHGPCLIPPRNDFDFAYCLKSENWPSVANNWIQRARFAGWPTKELVLEIAQKGIIYVPIGSKFGSSSDNPMEWRISFSEAEKLLARSFNHTQLLTYAMLKIILKEILKVFCDCKNILCSYHMKTLLFWTIEDSEHLKWSPLNLLCCFKSCIKRLSYFITNDFFPHYFIPENNLIDGKINKNIKQEMLSLFQLMLNDLISVFSQSDSLRGFLTYTKHSVLRNEQQTRDYNVDWGVFPLLFLVRYVRIGNLTIKRLGGILRQKWSKLETEIIAVAIAFLCHIKADYSLDFAGENNKVVYPNINFSKAILLIGTNIETSSWLKLIILYFNFIGKQEPQSKILEFVFSEIRQEKICIGASGKIDRCFKNFHGLEASLNQRHQLNFSHDFYCDEMENKNSYGIDTHPYSYPLIFICHVIKMFKNIFYFGPESDLHLLFANIIEFTHNSSAFFAVALRISSYLKQIETQNENASLEFFFEFAGRMFSLTGKNEKLARCNSPGDVMFLLFPELLPELSTKPREYSIDDIVYFNKTHT